MLLEDNNAPCSSSEDNRVLPVVAVRPARRYFVSSIFGSRKKSNGAMKAGLLGSNSRTGPTSPMESGKHSRLAVLGRLFKPWKWKRKKKSDKFEQTSRTLERKISMRSTKEELIKKGVLLPENGEKDQRHSPNLNNSCQDNHIPQSNGSISCGDSATDSNSFLPSSYFRNSIVVSSPQSVTVSSTSSIMSHHDLSLPVIHNVSLSNLPDVEEVPSQGGDMVLLSLLPEPPISVNEIGPIPPPPMFSNPSPLLTAKFQSQSGGEEMDDECSHRADSPCVTYIPQKNPSINTSKVEEIPAKEPQPMNAMPKKSALKKKGGVTTPTSQNAPIDPFQQHSTERDSQRGSDTNNESSRPLPSISVNEGDVSDTDSEDDSPILWRDYYGEDEQCRKAANVARKDSLALKLAQRPNIQELIDKNIYISPQIEKERQETREDVGKKLIRRLSLRPSADELEQRNILKFQTAEELEKEKEQKKKTLIRKLSFRPTIEELKERKIIRFNDYVEVTQAQDYDRRADKPWTRLTPRDKAAIRKELNEFKSTEMEVHADSRHLTRFHRP